MFNLRLWKAVQDCQNIIQISTNILLNGIDADVQGSETVHYQIDDVRHAHDALEDRQTITIGPELSTKKIVLYNTLTFTRVEVVTFFVSTPFMEVLDLTGKRVKCQVSPVFEYGSSMSTSKYQVSFIANVPALGLVSYVINAVTEQQVPE